MSNVIITYPWNPGRWTNHPFPHTWKDADFAAIARDYIDLLEYMGFDKVVLSAFPDDSGNPATIGEYQRAKLFIGTLERKGSTLTACLMYEPWDEPYGDIYRRLREMRTTFEVATHPNYARVGDRPEVYWWRCSNYEAEQNIRIAKYLDSLTGAPPWFIHARIRNAWETRRWPIDKAAMDAGMVDRTIDRGYQYPQDRYVDFGACAGGLNHAVAYNTASVVASTQQWLLRPDLDAFNGALARPVPEGADRVFRDWEHNEAGTLIPAGQEWAYVQAVRKALVHA